MRELGGFQLARFPIWAQFRILESSRGDSKGERLTDHALKIWDGTRPLLKRDVLTRTQVRIGQLDIIAATENLSGATDWAFEEEHHTIVVHLGGQLNRMDCEFSAGPSGSALPSRGDIWIIPAACRYAALAQGDCARFVEFNVPTALLGDVPLAARVQHRDDFIFAAADRLSELITEPEDDFSQMASHAITNALQFHLIESYGRRDPSTKHRSLTALERRRLASAVGSQLDTRISLGSLAALAGMEIRPFTSAFKEAFGLSPWQYVLQFRLNEAARLLRDTKMAVTDIALTVGFATPSHFSTAFTQRFGIPPTRYRRSIC